MSALGKVFMGDAAELMFAMADLIAGDGSVGVLRLPKRIGVYDYAASRLVVFDIAALKALAWQAAQEEAAEQSPIVEVGMPACPKCGAPAKADAS